ncbi:DUF1524 domain-containing protein [Mycobacterium koreense]|uniref:Deoxyribonuclease n=1 Tax=Mycolicibacillus koreensis TaxID=1069220 RepID=A0AA91SR44_9MYCO|nr:DUF1524 domain-containing protein [Mycolicibacillus koreensis]MCV7249831.1 DUF1524 domain-containing protein [Mycolicibacillus koreensis]OSC32871.1 deoxyribonuclease [Mycolicibacillus koreensis]
MRRAPSARAAALAATAAVLATAVFLTGCTGHGGLTDAVTVTPVATAEVPDDSPSALLAGLPVKGRAPKTGYDRALFGQAWSDDVTVAGGHNGCDTRNDVLRRDLTDTELKPGTNGCVVLRGILDDPYTGTVIDFQRGRGTSAHVQIDHVVALSDAWQKGAQQWDGDTRRNFANDPVNLQATSGPINEQKGDGDAATWLPPNKAYRCTYVSRIVSVKADYGLWVTQAEHDAIARIFAEDCGQPPVVVAPIPVPLAPPLPPPVDGPAVYFPNCAAARAAGAAPLYAGSPGYRPELDGDRDGIACE